MPLLATHRVTVRYGGLVAVNDMTVELEAGEIVGLIGPNGAGKTSLFEAISGFVAPASGTVFIDDVDVTTWTPDRRAAAGLTRTFQRLELFSHMAVLDNLLVAAENRRDIATAVRERSGVGRLLESAWAMDVLGLRRHDPEALELATEIAGRLGLGTVVRRPAGELPAGLGRLVEIGRALCTRPKVILLDEPTAGLDDRETDALAAVLREIVEAGGPSIFLVEHDVPFVTELAARVYVMEFGSLIAHGSPSQIRQDPQVRRAYLGT